ncbi:TonB-dependent receptor [Hymenobacter cavernae]|uniref:Collagen-binding protein n=1 Tax=Hymenobacter cavernae TaxID=2044852 RepID=A0ABQ1THK1_9BACT|nr:TonB-dependent receptor [Hymenobacter cavernae]GGE95765.1 collagen-binding protein [Hymenobacter cavernae]
MRKLLTLFLLYWLSTAAIAQTLSITGRALDAKDQSPLIGANVLLVHLPDSVKRGVAADPSGNFSFTGLAAGRYNLSVSFLGYQTLSRPVVLTTQSVALGNLALQAGVTLKGVEVIGKTPAAVQKGDTAQYNANAFKTNPDANAQDLVTKMPGITTQGGKVQAQGEDVQRVLVDGKEFFGNDPDAVLKNIPAEIIDNIQVFDRQSDQARFSGFNDGNTQKTINIVTKKQYRKGQFGRFVAGAGGGQQTGAGSSFAERYQVSGNYNTFSGDRRISIVGQSNNINQQSFGTADLLGVTGNSRGAGGGGGNGGGISRTNAIGLNYSDLWGKKTQVTASYFFNQSNNTTNRLTDRIYATRGSNGEVPASEQQTFQQTSLADSRNTNHRFNLRLEHKIDSVNSLLFVPSFTVQQNSSSSKVDGITRVGDAERGNVTSTYGSKASSVSSSNQLLYRHRFGKPGRTISVDLNANYNTRNSDNNLYSFSRSLSTVTGTSRDTTLETTLDQLSRLDQTGWQLNSGISYTEPLSKQDLLQFNYNASYAPNDSDKKTYDFSELTGDYDNLNTGLSNVFKSNYLTQGLGASYRRQNKDYQVMLGVTGQKADLENKQHFPQEGTLNRTFYNFLPNAMLRYNFSQQRNLRFNYNGRTSAPGISQLQEVVNNSNPLQLTTGNPNLIQQYQHVMTLRYSTSKPEKSTSFFVGAFATFTDNYITNSTFVALRDTTININGGVVQLPLGGQLTRPVNLGQQYTLRTFAVYGMPIAIIKSNLNINGSLGYSRTPGINNELVNYSRSPNANLGVTISSNISPNLDFTVSSNGNVTYARNTVNTRLNTNYYTQNSSARLSWIVGPGISIQSDITHTYNQGIASAPSQQYFLWNASIGKKVFPNQRGEIKVYAFDLLKQNRSLQNNISTAYNETVRTNNLQQYFMAMFTFNLRKGNVPQENRGQDRERNSDNPNRGNWRRGSEGGGMSPGGSGGGAPGGGFGRPPGGN